MTRTRHHQAGYAFKKGSNWYLRYREDVLLENGSIKRVQKCRKLAKAIGQCRTKNYYTFTTPNPARHFNDENWSAVV